MCDLCDLPSNRLLYAFIHGGNGGEREGIVIPPPCSTMERVVLIIK